MSHAEMLDGLYPQVAANPLGNTVCSLFCFLFSVSCLLSPVCCLLSSMGLP